MKIALHALDGKANGQVQLPAQFEEPLRVDLIKKAVLSLQSKARQPYGADPEAGKKHATDISRRRRDYKGSYGKGISRVPRKVLSRNGGNFNWVGALAPGMRGGRRAHPPKASKNWERKINTKENRKAIRSAISATIDKNLVTKRGHKVPAHYPFIIADGIEQVQKTSELKKTLDTLGFGAELERAAIPQVRSGRSAIRGRAHKQRISVLLVTSADAPVAMAAGSIPGVQAVAVNALNAEILAPGVHPGRATIFTQSALKHMEEKKLFL